MSKHTRSRVPKGVLSVRNASTGEVKYVGGIGGLMRSAANELSEYISDANSILRKGIHSQSEVEPDWHDTQTCYELGNAAKEVDKLTSRVAELEAALGVVSDRANRGTQECTHDGYDLACDVLDIAEEALKESGDE